MAKKIVRGVVLKKRTLNDIYGVSIELFVAKNAAAATSVAEAWLGREDVDLFSAFTMWHHSDFAMVFCADDLAHRFIGHEILHCTHRIMEWVGDKFSKDHHEAYAYLCGWITAWVYRELKKAKIKISNT